MKTGMVVFMMGVGGILFHSCNAEFEGPSQKAHAMLQEKVDRFKDKIHKECLEEIRLAAEQSVDSVLLSRALNDKINKIENPELTDRPERPEIEFPEFDNPGE